MLICVKLPAWQVLIDDGDITSYTGKEAFPMNKRPSHDTQQSDERGDQHR